MLTLTSMVGYGTWIAAGLLISLHALRSQSRVARLAGLGGIALHLVAILAVIGRSGSHDHGPPRGG